MGFKDYYKIMGVARDALTEDVKRAYRKLARKYYPDVSKESTAEAKFMFLVPKPTFRGMMANDYRYSLY